MIEAWTKLLQVLAWPTVALVIVILMRREIRGLFGRVREIEGPGAVKVSLDPDKVGQILDQARKENASPAIVAERIVQSATVLDRRESRILRALVDDDGRALYSYQSDYYKPSLDAMLAKGYVRRLSKGFALTDEGYRVARDYLLGVLSQRSREGAHA